VVVTAMAKGEAVVRSMVVWVVVSRAVTAGAVAVIAAVA
jgi:hypothetical protein